LSPGDYPGDGGIKRAPPYNSPQKTLKGICIEVPLFGDETIISAGFVPAKLTDKVAWSVQMPLIIRMNQESK